VSTLSQSRLPIAMHGESSVRKKNS